MPLIILISNMLISTDEMFDMGSNAHLYVEVVNCKIAFRHISTSGWLYSTNQLSSFDSAICQTSLFLSPANTYADQMAEVLASELDKVAQVKKCARLPPKPLTK